MHSTNVPVSVYDPPPHLVQNENEHNFLNVVNQIRKFKVSVQEQRIFNA